MKQDTAKCGIRVRYRDRENDLAKAAHITTAAAHTFFLNGPIASSTSAAHISDGATPLVALPQATHVTIQDGLNLGIQVDNIHAHR
ncbi:hypothetical protein AA23498_1830 [Acetobacter nitrogenifigens DSM 23921 = NBRC 105050]|uniref:Uncharacterized protein n=1 Tax=Acetobacter nitrogenifigens DSM 23921 = NBRC 105050 TaxID=1120919 RepID=A0A511X9P9_9PROT|nr:hypothetical protein AA23498_1830 [Acetobacter nitrogenifigens DSM 23921 = NBRC 105050]GEN59669.1 hypothetical protein ANI02nite_15530 [Acetobacter nitrogenifigens DSM 23921 = NBRC 105050]